MEEAPILNFYLHTHWDREWYLPYETYRAQLVEVVRDILDRLESGELPHFLLDGQSCVLEDAVELVPSLRERICALMRTAKLLGGPWYVLADQTLVGGESLIRNLKIGIDCTNTFGPAAMIGYCPDTFGHTADMPRILRGFGINCAFVWRGVPRLDGPPVFWWRSNDGSEVLAYHLHRGYYQMMMHSEDDETLKKHVNAFLDRAASVSMKGKELKHPGVLVPIGADHVRAPAQFKSQMQRAAEYVEAVAAGTTRGARQINVSAAEAATHSDTATTLSTLAQSCSLGHHSLTEFAQRWHDTARKNRDEFATVSGELRDNAAALGYERAYMLQGVLSTRLYLKRENRLAEHRLINLCEPLYTWLSALEGFDYPGEELVYAWKLLLKNHPHDSICGCSIDPVHREMMVRTSKLHHLLNALDARAAEHVLGGTARLAIGTVPVPAPDVQADALAIWNFSTDPVSSPVMVSWANDVEAAGKSTKRKDSTNIQLISKEREPLIFSGTGQEPDVRTADMNKAWLWAPDVPAFGVKEFPLQSTAGSGEGDNAIPLSEAKGRSVSNGLLALTVEPNGSLLVTATDPATTKRTQFKIGHHLRDIADGGDTYNFDPVPADKPIEAVLTDAQPWQRGPLVASLRLTYEIAIPTGLNDLGQSGDENEQPKRFVRSHNVSNHIITTEVSLKRGIPILFFDTRFVNKSDDHRLEIVFDTGAQVQETISENHFSLLRRSTTASAPQLPVEKGCEAPLDRYPCQRFFIAGDQLFLNKGMPEYGVDGSTVSITALRAVSQLSRPRLFTRGGGAGPPVATPEANCPGLNQVSYGWAPLMHKGSETQLNEEAYRLAELLQGTLWAIPVRRGYATGGESLFTVKDPAIRFVSLFKSGRNIVMRLLNVSPEPCEATLTARLTGYEGHIADLGERLQTRLEPLEFTKDGNVYALPFGSNELITIVFCPNQSDEAIGRIRR